MQIQKVLSSEIELNKRYTFDSFVLGASNRDAFNRALDVAKYPANRHNPLFVTGGEGLGKTHLMLAIGNYILKKKRATKVRYVTAEKFINDLVASFRQDRYDDFRKNYCASDVFLLDDIQFLRNKDRTVDELVCILNALYKAGKQIVITSDGTPEQSLGIKGRLPMVLKAGTIVKIKRPDKATKVAILKMKSQLGKFNLPVNVLTFLANRATSNTRALEGSLVKVAAYASFTGRAVTLPLAKECLIKRRI